MLVRHSSGSRDLCSGEEVDQLECRAEAEQRTKFVCLCGEVFVTEDFILRDLRCLPMLDLSLVKRCLHKDDGQVALVDNSGLLLVWPFLFC